MKESQNPKIIIKWAVFRYQTCKRQVKLKLSHTDIHRIFSDISYERQIRRFRMPWPFAIIKQTAFDNPSFDYHSCATYHCHFHNSANMGLECFPRAKTKPYFWKSIIPKAWRFSWSISTIRDAKYLYFRTTLYHISSFILYIWILQLLTA